MGQNTHSKTVVPPIVGMVATPAAPSLSAAQHVATIRRMIDHLPSGFDKSACRNAIDLITRTLLDNPTAVSRGLAGS